MQRATALSVIGFAALALWSSSAAAVTVPLPPAAPAIAAEAAAPIAAAAPDTPDVPAVAAPASTPAPPVPDVAAPVAVPAAAPTVPAPAIQVPKPPVISVSSVHTAATDSISEASKAATAKAVTDSLPAPVKDPVDAAAPEVHVPAVASVLAANPPGSPQHPKDLGRLASPRTPRALAPAITVTVHRIARMIGNVASTSPLIPAIAGASDSAGAASASTAPESMHGGGTPGLPGLPSPLQIPLAGAASGSGSSSSTGFFLFGFAALLAGLIAPAAPALSRRLRGSPASWRPAPYLSLLELPG